MSRAAWAAISSRSTATANSTRRSTDEYDEGLEETLFTGTRLPGDWIERFESTRDAQEALAKEFDAFIPYIGARGAGDVVSISGFDSKEFDSGDYLRIDLIGFGGTRLEPAGADHQLLGAIKAGDADAVRSAVAAGADLHRLPGEDTPPLHLALRLSREGKPWRDVVTALVELGADLHEPGHEPPIHVVLDTFIADQAELIDLLELLTAHGADVNAEGVGLVTRGVRPLHLAARRGWLAVAKFLVSKGADPRAANLLKRTPRQAAEAAVQSLKGFSDGDTDAKYAAVIAFLDDVEAGRADLDWHADAEEASRRELRRQREMKVAFSQIEAGMKTLGRIAGDDPSPQALADAITFTQPDEIHLTPSADPWPSEAARAETAALLAAEGFEPIGRYAIPGLKVRLEAYHHPREHLYAALYDAAGESVFDLVRYGHDDTRLTVTNNNARPETHFDMPDRRTVRLPGAPPADLLQAVRAEPEPRGGVAPAPAGEFVARFEDAYRQEIKARKRQVRRE